MMVLEDLVASGCRFPDPRGRRHRGPRLRHRREPRPPARGLLAESRASGRAATSRGSRTAPASGDGGAHFVQMAIDNLTDRLPDGFANVAETTSRTRRRDPGAVPRRREHVRARRPAPRQPLRRRRRPDAHRLPRLGGDRPRARHARRRVRALRVDARPSCAARTSRRSSRATARCSPSTASRSTPTSRGSSTACSPWYGWCSATCTAAMGSRWQPEHIGLGGTERGDDRGARPRLRRPDRREARLRLVCDTTAGTREGVRNVAVRHEVGRTRWHPRRACQGKGQGHAAGERRLVLRTHTAVRRARRSSRRSTARRAST